MEKSEFKKIVEASGILSVVTDANLPALNKRGLAFGVTGICEVEGKEVEIIVAVSQKFPNEHPAFFFSNQKNFDRIPHVEDDGFICYTHDDTLVLDIDNPEGILQDCFILAVQTISDGFLQKNKDDFYNEYEAYWRRLKNATTLYTNISVSENVAILKYTRLKDKNGFFAAGDETNRIGSYKKFFRAKDDSPQFFNGLFIPLLEGSKIFVPNSEAELTIGDIRKLVTDNVSEANKKVTTRLLTKTKAEDLLVFCLPQPNGFYSLFGARLKNISHSIHPLLSDSSRARVIPLTVIKLDPEYMVARGGNGQQFFEKKVLVIGGGSVGGFICEELIKAAVVQIDVVDRETLMSENCYRHSCGFMYVGKNKAVAIKEKLENYYPHAMVNAISMAIEDALKKKKIQLKDYNAIVVATGNATINQYLNKLFRKEVSTTPVIFSWLDPFGIGGHCLVTNIKPAGCYQCLYTNDDLHNAASFADKLQQKSFTKNIAGCGSVYVPYGSLDALQTAILTVRKLIDVFLSKENTSAIYSWKGNSDLFTSEGYNLSPRFFLTEKQLYESKDKFYKSNCSVCGGK